MKNKLIIVEAIKKIKLGPKALIVAAKYEHIKVWTLIGFVLLVSFFIGLYYLGMNFIEYGL